MDVALLISLAVLVVAGYAIAKNYDTKLVLFRTHVGSGYLGLADFERRNGDGNRLVGSVKTNRAGFHQAV
ncbi:hypothetical protein [Serratia sp. PL7]|uniref:hypothetical protein n=1 Tax=Serratia sp. PL7 TaxID=2952201 RepID=UPI001B3C9C07|nr:hypothetical protein [Serratia sp. PL7]